ncbi:hypothetical protein RvY_08942-2 [Ramazzottius varieornatus]|uniref:tRNA pseudouridine synthase n=1 Tax=Ramazzottius varieornatus TaxID=947166 RepID=A0A1D1V9U0_RAMVA|nr:hypothetical protein RvY_08942-2 [Ramazzottius varieornatus]
MVRYLLLFSYVGTRFSGSQRQAAYDVKRIIVSTVQDVIEEGLLKLRSRTQPRVFLASRTDAGVHALCSAGHVDLVHFADNKYYHQDAVTYILNKHCEDNDHALRILRTLIVPDSFNCRFNAKSRTYVYRIAIQLVDPLAGLSKDVVPPYTRKASQTPLFETDRLAVVSPPFDIDAAKKACSLFLGTHNFTSFMKKPAADELFPRNPVRFMQVADLSPGTGFLGEHNPFKSNLEYWDFTFRSSGFLQRQVRRMVGTVIAVARGKLTLDQVQYMLDNPSHDSWMKMNVGHSEADGLYLKDIEYDEKGRLPSSIEGLI